MLEIKEHGSTGYAPRTCTNAQGADLTVAFAVDFTTAGERLTCKMSSPRYVAIDFGQDPTEAARKLYRALRHHDAKTLNVAGNGIYTLALHGWTQSCVNIWVFEVLSTVFKHWQIEKVRSGGQTGVDIAGVVAAYALGIPALALFPKGYVQRDSDGVDRQLTESEIRVRIRHWAGELMVSGAPLGAVPRADTQVAVQ